MSNLGISFASASPPAPEVRCGPTSPGEFPLLAQLHQYGIGAIQKGDTHALLQHLLDATMAATHADFGVVHLADEASGRLEVAVHQGRWPDGFDVYDPADGCQEIFDVAWHHRGRLLIEDVCSAPAYSVPTRQSLVRCGISSVDSTPLVASGYCMGMLTVCVNEPGRIQHARQQIIDIAITHTADFLRETSALERLRAQRVAEAEAQVRAEAATRRRDDFLAVLSHELRQPLSAIWPALEVHRQSADGDHRRRALEIIEQQVHQLTGLVEDITDLAHIHRGTSPLRKDRIDLRAVIRQAVDMARPALTSKQQELSVSLGFEPVWVVVDPLRMKQVFSNLLHNAALYTAARGHVRIALEVDGDWAVVRVLDDGMGISSIDLDRIFSLFERGSKTPEVPGLGIGLSIVRQVLDMHGGAVSVLSDGTGRGSEFIARVPVTATPGV